MMLFVCTDHDGHYPVGVSSVIVAESEEQARELLRAELKEHGLDPNEPFTLQPRQLDRPQAYVLNDGDY